MLWRVWKRAVGSWLVLLSWIVVYGGIIGSFYVKYMRYMLPLYPFLILMASALLLALCVGNRVGARLIAPNAAGWRGKRLFGDWRIFDVPDFGRDQSGPYASGGVPLVPPVGPLSQFVGNKLSRDAVGDVPLVPPIGLSSQFVGNQLGCDAVGDVPHVPPIGPFKPVRGRSIGS